MLSESERALPDDALLALARDAFAVGTCRRGLTIANFVLQRAPRSEAASIKAQFLEHLDAQQPFSPS